MNSPSDLSLRNVESMRASSTGDADGMQGLSLSDELERSIYDTQALNVRLELPISVNARRECPTGHDFLRVGDIESMTYSSSLEIHCA